MNIFQEAADYEAFLGLLRRAATTHGAAIHAYVLMTNHVHLIVTPRQPESLPKTMKELGSHYVRFYNKKYERTGTLWNGRYRGFLIEDEVYWLTCLRYVEQNPVRASMTNTAADYRWSSYRAHALGNWPDWLAPHPAYQALGRSGDERQRAYRALCMTPLPGDELVLSRQPVVGVRQVSDGGQTPI